MKQLLLKIHPTNKVSVNVIPCSCEYMSGDTLPPLVSH